MKIVDFANNVLSSANAGKFFDSDSLATKSVLDKIANKSDDLSYDQIYEQLIPSFVTSTWQTLLESPGLADEIYPKAMSGISKSPYLNKNTEKFVLCLGNGNYCLLIFDPDLTTDEPIYFDASKNQSERSIVNGFAKWKNQEKAGNIHFSNQFTKWEKTNDSSSSFFQKYDSNWLNEDILIDNIKYSDWPVIITKPPKRIFTSLLPKTCHKVVLQSGQPFKSLAGVYTTNEDGVFGCTISLHSFGDLTIESGKTQVIINGKLGTVLTIHPVSDSCFIKIEEDLANKSTMRFVNGPLSLMAPRDYQKCSFVNKESNKKETNIIGWSPDILYTNPYNQVKVLTNPSTNPGDSGSALIDENDNVLGFSFYRTEINAIKEFSAWIWAASVYNAHKLKP